jgi:hypothetical protein
MAGLGGPIAPDVLAQELERDLAQELGRDPAGPRSWPRSRVREWLNQSITVSADGAFKAGAALVRLGAPVSAPEALFASAHMPAFLEFLALLALEDANAAASLAILPFTAFTFGSLNPIHMEVTGDWLQMGTLAKQALTELRSRAWPHAAFQRAWDRYGRSQTAIYGESASYSQAMIVKAHDIAASPQIPIENAIDVAFPFIVDWVVGLPVEPAVLADLIPIANEAERFALTRRHGFRNTLIDLCAGLP